MTELSKLFDNFCRGFNVELNATIENKENGEKYDCVVETMAYLNVNESDKEIEIEFDLGTVTEIDIEDKNVVLCRIAYPDECSVYSQVEKKIIDILGYGYTISAIEEEILIKGGIDEYIK